MVAVPSIASSDRQIDRMNRVTQSVRNLGYVGGPALGGVLYTMANGLQGLLWLAMLVLFAAPATMICLKTLRLRNAHSDQSQPKKQLAGLNFSGLFRSNGVVGAVCPLLITVIFTSALNVLLIFRVRTELQLSAETYGLIVSVLSIGLVIGPITLSAIFARIGDAAGASLAAAFIGLGILWLALTETVWSIASATMLIGAANGIQNALMASFMMKAIDPEHRINQMPAYVFCIQASVFLGFMGAGSINAAHVSEGLMVVGFVTAIVGGCGFALNVRNRPSSIAKGVY